jgi:putative cell wall-binding protein
MSMLVSKDRLTAALAVAAIIAVGTAAVPAAAAGPRPTTSHTSHHLAAQTLLDRLHAAKRMTLRPSATGVAHEQIAATPGPFIGLDVFNDASADTLLVDRGAGSDLLFNRGAGWVDIPGSGNGSRGYSGSAGAQSVVWQTGTTAYRYDTTSHVVATLSLASDEIVFGNTDAGWLIGTGDDDGYDGIKNVTLQRVSTAGGVLATYHLSATLSLRGLRNDASGLIYTETSSDYHTGAAHYIDFGTGVDMLLRPTSYPEVLMGQVSLTPTVGGFWSVNEDTPPEMVPTGQAFRLDRGSADLTQATTLPWSEHQAAGMVAVGDSATAWTTLDYGYNPPRTNGLYTRATGSSVAAGLPGGAGLLVARKSDFAIVAADETTAAAVRTLAPLGHSTVALPPLPVPSSSFVTRLSGADRYAAAAGISAANFAPHVTHAYIATGMNFPDALAGAPVAAVNSSPILLVPGTSIPQVVQTELTRLAPGSITVLGGAGSVSESVKTQLAAFTAGAVTRLSGSDRYAAAAAISAASFAPHVTHAYIATGANFPDALAGAPVAGINSSPVLLVPGTSIPQVVQDELTRLAPGSITVLGGAGSVSESVKTQLAAFTAGAVTRLSGADRYSAAAAISDASFTPPVTTLYIATGATFPDALAGAPVAGMNGSPILLVPGTSIPTSVRTEITHLAPTNIVVLGGPGSVTDGVRQALGTLLTP